ncbi:MAG: hypothetical protein HRT87_11140, partial [Legionellales bacterium]|nr:hypothetical protein [Legionellales bacterium]
GAIITNCGWRSSALVTPLVWLSTGVLFYSAILFENVLLTDVFTNFITNPANLILMLGTLQISLGRGCKYTIFDATKEMCFIPLSKYEQRKSKAIVDGIASRLGKSFGSIFYIILLLLCGNISATIPFVSIIIIGLTLLWIYSILKLYKLVPGLQESTNSLPTKDNHSQISQTTNTITQS